MTSSLIDNREIRVFISSTFCDMQGERSELIRKTFPRLRELAARRNVTLTEVDLRWGITKEESESGKVIEICLREVENSIPFFLGIIGNHYGWVPAEKDLSDIVKERFPDVLGYVERRLSATEIEMQFGVLDRTDVDMNAFFFIKEGEEVTEVDNPEKLVTLKKTVRKNKKYPVSSYSDPEDLADQVFAVFTKLLDDLFPEGDLSKLERERIGQCSFLNSLCRVYIKNESNFVIIDEWMRDWKKHQLVITCESGLGKSSLVANWINEKLSYAEGLPYRIIYHFIGCGGSHGDECYIVDTLCKEIRDRYGFDTGDVTDEEDEKSLDNLFGRVAAEGDKPLLLVLDGINNILNVFNAKLLNWLPSPPRNVKILFTTLEDDETMRVFKDRCYPVFTLRRLNREERIRMIETYLYEVFRKRLLPAQLERIVDDPQNENTLVLKTLLDELANFGVFEKLDEKIEEFLRPDNIYDFYQVFLANYEADFGELLVRHFLSLIAVSRYGLTEEGIMRITDTEDKPILWSQFYCSFRQHLIAKNGFISFSHAFIRDAVEGRYLKDHEDWVRSCREEIVAALAGEKVVDEVPYQLDKLGDLTRLHDYLMDLDVFSYLHVVEETTLGGYWHKLMDTGEYSLEEYIDQIDHYEENERMSLYMELSRFTLHTVVDLSLSIQFAERALTYARSEDVKANVFNQLGLSYQGIDDYPKAMEYYLMALKIRQRILGEEHLDVAISYNNVGVLYRKMGDHKKALEYQLKALDINQMVLGKEHQIVARSYDNVGVAYRYLGEFQVALEYGLKALQIYRKVVGDEHPAVATAYDNVGVTYGWMGNLQEALKYEMKSLEILRKAFGEKHPDMATSYNNVGMTYGRMGDLGKALEYLLKALEIKKMVFGEEHSGVATSYNNIGGAYERMGDLVKALEYYLKALEIRKMVFGEDHPDVAMSFTDVGLTYGRIGDPQKALEYLLKALEIRIIVFGEVHPDVAMSFDNVGSAYERMGNLQEMLKYKLKVLEILRSFFGDEHPAVATAYDNVGVTYEKMGDPQMALKYYLKALQTLRSLFGEIEPSVAELYEYIGRLYNDLGDYTKAREYCSKAQEIERTLEDRR